ncbi:MAG: NAD(P)-dependent oxidoreductase [Gammaproteobacteria bacterium]
MKILLTGATGFIGSYVLPQLIAQGHDVISLARRPVLHQKVINIVIKDFDLRHIVQKLKLYPFDIVIHLAAAGVNPQNRQLLELIKMNSILTGLLFSAAAYHQAKAVLIAGSCAEYSIQSSVPHTCLVEQAPYETEKLYGSTKAVGTLHALSLSELYQIPLAVLRIFNVFGLGEAKYRLLPSLINNLSKGKEVKLTSGKQIRDFIYIKDTVDAILVVMNSLLQKQIVGGVYNVATSIGHSVFDFCNYVTELMNADPTLLKFGTFPMRPDEYLYVVGDNTKLRKACGWQPKFSLLEGLQDVLTEYFNLSKCYGATT